MVDPVEASLLQAAIAPAFLISGTSVFLNFTQSRLFRVMDRTRERLVRRAFLLRAAIAFGVLAVAAAVGSALLVMSSGMAGIPPLGHLAPLAFAAGLACLLLALVLVFLDALASVAGVGKA